MIKIFLPAYLGYMMLSVANLQAQQILLFEDFESGDFEAKGWYDGFPDQRTNEEFRNGMYSYEGHFAQGSYSSGAGRHLFTPTDRVYMSYWVKYSSNYVGSGVGYHPHEWNILTTEDWEYQGPANTHLTLYVEQNAGRPILAMQDSRNVDPNCVLLNNNSFVGCDGDFDSYSFTENRSVCSCNGLVGEVDRRDCFPSGGSEHGYYSSRAWAADTVYFRDTPGLYYKNDWHFVESYFELNSIANGIGIADGKIRYWYDGQLLISSDSILFRTGTHPDMLFNQLFFGGYIGDGSPVDQTWWVDDLTIADGLLTVSNDQSTIDNLQLNIYPNPNDGDFTLEFLGDDPAHERYAFTLFNVVGDEVFSDQLADAKKRYQLSLAPGMYYCKVNAYEEGGSAFVKKLIIQ